ncbi:MAG: FprA family A-type flavoprotein [Desulfohalobium sp.]
MAITQLKNDIYWVGSVDWNLHNFHGYSQAHRGTTYNAYLVIDDKVTLFDTVPAKHSGELMHQIRRIIEPEKIDYIVVNHAEPDHSGALPHIVDTIQPSKIFCSPMGKQAVAEYFHRDDLPLEVVKNGSSISLGKRSVEFMEARMLHWPDSMFSFIPEDKLLIPNDAFGQNWAGSERFDDEVDLNALLTEAAHYYANIILPFSPLVQKVLEKITKAGWDIDMIAPDHGLIWRSHVKEILEAYDRFSKQEPRQKAVIVYDTMWHSTEQMAKAIADALIEEGIPTRLMHLKAYHHSDVMAEAWDAAAIIYGSPTHNNGIMPLVADMATYMKGLRPTNKIGAAFGSYGWSGESVKHLTEQLEQMGFDLPVEGVRSKFRPNHDELAQCKEMGRKLATAIKEKLRSS